MPKSSRPVLFFDGVCNFCNSSVQWIIRHDRDKNFLFASLQSAAGAEAKKKAGENLDSIILLHNGEYVTKSDAALRIASLLGGGWALLATLKVIPRAFRDWVYDLIARNRYRWFGKKEACMIPAPELRERFVEELPASLSAV